MSCSTGFECGAVKEQHIQEISVANIRMLSGWMDNILKDQVKNEYIRGKLEVALIEDTITLV